MLLEKSNQHLRERHPPYAIPLVPRIRSDALGQTGHANTAGRRSVLPLLAIAVTTVFVLMIGVVAGMMLRTETRLGPDARVESAPASRSDNSLLERHHATAREGVPMVSPNLAESGELQASLPQVPLPEHLAASALASSTSTAPQEETPDDASAKPSTAPNTAPELADTLIRPRACCGDPFGVGRLVVHFADAQMPIMGRQPLLKLTEEDNRVRFPVFDIQYANDDAAPRRVRHITVHFLFLDDAPLRISLTSTADDLLANYEVVPVRAVEQHTQLLDGWWKSYDERVRELKGHARVVQQLMRRALARRLDLAVPPYPTQGFQQQSLAKLERQFERTVSTLLGIDSLLLAVPDPAADRDAWHLETADRPVPSRLRLPAVRIAANVSDVDVEPLAYRVPSDCFYLRCRSLANYAWLRDFVTGWGGSLQEIVSLPTLRHPIRKRVETQLAMSLHRSQQLGMDRAISDMALIGCDFFFRDGAALGVLLEAKVPRSLHKIVEQQRVEVLRTVSQSTERTLQIDGLSVSLMETPDRRVRSYYVRDDRYFLISNCERIVRNFIETRRSAESLGKLNEYRYVLSRMKSTPSQRVLIYLSDPFFRQLASPHYRTEVTRRANSLADIHEVNAARIVAASEGRRIETVGDLARAGYLPSKLEHRADGSKPIIVGQKGLDSLRGCRGTFVPIPDMEVQRLTGTEVTAYHQFAQQYQRQWGRVDPLAVSISSEPSRDGIRQQVQLGIYIAPYARSRYAFLSRYLAPPSTVIVNAAGEEDVLAVDATLRDARGRHHQVHMGLRDRTIPFHVDRGKLVLEEKLVGSSFGTSSQYVAVTPSGTDGIQLVKRFLNDLQHGQASPVTTRSGSSTSALPSLFRLLFGGNTVRLLAAIFAANALETRGEWTVYAPDSEIRSAMLRRLRRDVADEPAQIRFTVVDPEETKVARYLHAFAYVESRRASERNLEMLNQLPMQLGVSTERADDLIQDIFAARPACPLGGEYVLSAGQEAASWTSTAWSTEPRGAFNQVPDDYRFPFLAWFRGTDLRFTLSRDTLRADAVLWVGNGNPARSAGENAAPHGPSTVAARSAQEVEAGDRVFVNAANAELRLGNRTLATLPRGTSLSVLEIQKGWIGVETESRRSRLRGWVRRRHLQKR